MWGNKAMCECRSAIDKYANEKVLELTKPDGHWEIKVDNIQKFKGKHGVWAMCSGDGKLLEVAQTRDIYAELKRDLIYLLQDYSAEADTTKGYTARKFSSEFSEEFTVFNKNRTASKYRDIAEKFKKVVAYVILEDDAVCNVKERREDIEMRIAICGEALYWNAYGTQRKNAYEYLKEKMKTG